MPEKKEKFYLTTPIYYTNGLPHIGHTYTTVVADVIRRYKRMRGYDVVMTTGTDEHGVNVERAAKKADIPESEFVAKMADAWRALWDELGIPADEFIRTTDLKHVRTVQWLFKLCRENGYVYKGHYTGQYCIYDNAFVNDAKPGDNCPDCGRPLETVTEENYFFKLSSFQKPLLDFYKKNPDFIQPDTRRNEIISFVEGGLKDLSITRTTIRWGIPVPGEEPHVFYVWFDALTAYLSAVGGPEYEKRGYWPADLHLVGKDIIRFHAVYWPAFLMAAMLPVPKQVWAHGWFLMDAAKMSKSKGNVVLPRPIVNMLGMDALRYFLLRDVVFGQDGNFSYDALVTRYNSDLANGLGNLASRVLTMIQNFFEGRIPSPSRAGVDAGHSTLGSSMVAIKGLLTEGAWDETGKATAKGHYDSLKFAAALQEIWQFISMVDNFLTQEKPWELAKDTSKKDHLAEVLYEAAEALRCISVLAHPVIPNATQALWGKLGLPGEVGREQMDELNWGGLKGGEQIKATPALFPRVDHQEAIERIEAMANEELNPTPAAPVPAASAPVATGASAAAAPAPAVSDKIGIEDFTKVEMRVGQIKTAERIVGADKLLKLTVDIGTEIRQICAGIAQYYEPESLIGRKVAVVVNLAPRKLRGVESNGMIVAASVGPEGRPVLTGFHEEVEVGARLK
ncbi:MAG TPA: methionine--tRNA ligase [Candidatus Acidoferrales bacterium]|jgi:methionyl-tRNA synthetase|nr:methionine--tRNA ligase [Candidatus Acidoferrales bacterium]